jgi:hypothetical protein
MDRDNQLQDYPKADEDGSLLRLQEVQDELMNTGHRHHEGCLVWLEGQPKVAADMVQPPALD